ncbi:hypothetical protein V5O48_009692 [Marasmius crinis-equi]|uniref:BZIP domain-containing protein n=1 Tax=Marasmius crinis-equi TaxID=585013 RepID=A0ABR3FAI8_9AGAR
MTSTYASEQGTSSLRRRGLLVLYRDYLIDHPDAHPLEHPLLHSFVFPPDLPPSDPPSPVSEIFEEPEPQEGGSCSTQPSDEGDSSRDSTSPLSIISSVDLHSRGGTPEPLAISAALAEVDLHKGEIQDIDRRGSRVFGFGSYAAGDYLRDQINAPPVAEKPDRNADAKSSAPKPPKYRKTVKAPKKETAEQLAHKRERQRQNSKAYYQRHSAAIKERAKQRKERSQLDQSEEIMRADLETRRAKQREYARRYRQKHKECINVRERVRRRMKEDEM